jgi:ATP diphosphatase
MRRLRDPAGLRVDLAQDGRSLARYALEEAHRLVAALEAGAPDAVRDELGDLLFQVVFHAQLAVERATTTSMPSPPVSRRTHARHPACICRRRRRQFRAVGADQGRRARRPGRTACSTMCRCHCPRCCAPQSWQAGRHGRFDWTDADGARAKVLEELAEVDAATQESARARRSGVGDLLLPSPAWRGTCASTRCVATANQRFEDRSAPEACGRGGGLQLEGLIRPPGTACEGQTQRSVLIHGCGRSIASKVGRTGPSGGIHHEQQDSDYRCGTGSSRCRRLRSRSSGRRGRN